MTEWRFGDKALDYAVSDYIPPAVQMGFWPRINLAARHIRQARFPDGEWMEIGCNGGHLLATVGKPCWGYDIAAAPLEVARASGLDARYADITSDEMELAPVVAICEVLEHLEDPHGLLARICRDPVHTVIASGPVLETDEDHYEQHLWAWDEEGFAALFEGAGFTVTTQESEGIFQVLVAVR
jgi:hypothetical protein